MLQMLHNHVPLQMQLEVQQLVVTHTENIQEDADVDIIRKMEKNHIKKEDILKNMPRDIIANKQI
jgi:hypothetical protein